MERYYGEKPEMAWVDINKLDVDNSYQRNTNGYRSKENIKKIVSNFCWEEFTPITVVKTEKGTYNIIDGQHRYKAAVALGDIKELPCWIINKTSVKKQADTFIGINKNRVSTNPYDLYKAQIATENPDAIMIDNFCNKAGIIIPFDGYCSKPCMTLAISTIRKHLKAHNDGYLLEAIKNIRKAFPETKSQIRSEILNTLVELKIEYGAKIKDEEIQQTLIAFESVDRIIAKARELKALDGSISTGESHKKVFLNKLKEVRKK